MPFSLHIDTDNAAFSDEDVDGCYQMEVARILRHVASRLTAMAPSECDPVNHCALFDLNGNEVGDVVFTRSHTGPELEPVVRAPKAPQLIVTRPEACKAAGYETAAERLADCADWLESQGFDVERVSL